MTKPNPTLLSGRRMGVTSGPTRAWIDPVRFVANASSGELGARIADRLSAHGASVDLIAGPGARLPENGDIRVHSIDTVEDLLAKLEEFSKDRASPFDAWVHAMAVLDYAPAQSSSKKISSDREELTLHLSATPKAIDRMKKLFPEALLVGFKLETTDDESMLRASAEKLMNRASCDLVVANQSPFRAQADHHAYLCRRRESDWLGPYSGKDAIAESVAQWLISEMATHVRS